MSHCKIKTEIEILDNSGVIRRFNTSDTLTGVNEIFVQEFDLAADATQIVWDPTNWTGMQVSDFDRLILMSDGTVDVELTINEGDANEELNSLRVIANVPLVIGADDAYYNHSASDIFAGTLDVIDKIRIDEPNSTARKITLILVT